MPRNHFPTKEEWRSDLGLTLGYFGGKQKSPVTALNYLGKLFDAYYEEKLYDVKAEILFSIYQQLMYVAKNHNKKDKLGGTITEQQIAAVSEALGNAEENLRLFLGATESTLPDLALEHFGRAVDEYDKNSDQQKFDNGTLQVYRSAAERRALKLSFRNGLAHKKVIQGEKTKLIVYDTVAQGDSIPTEKGAGSLYVMSGKGQIFVSGKNATSLVHSSFLAGQDTLAAGTIFFTKGQLNWISGSSGHYRPTVKQIVTALERFLSYGVKLDNVLVYRENYGDVFKTANPKYFESCKAKDLMKARSWPNDKAHGNDMRVE